LLKNDNQTLPLDPHSTKIALIGPFADTLNFGGYSGALGQHPAQFATTLRQGMLGILKEANKSAISNSQLRTAWGADSWNYKNQYVIPPYLLSAEGVPGGLQGTYFEDMDFKLPRATRRETPAGDWGLYPPEGLTSNNFSATWEGQIESPVDMEVTGYLGVAVGRHSKMRLFIDGSLLASHNFDEQITLLPNILSYEFTQANMTTMPPNAAPFLFKPGAKHDIRIEYQALNLENRIANEGSVNSQIFLWWNLVPPDGNALSQAVSIAAAADVVVLALGTAWNSDGENADSATLQLSEGQDALATAIFQLGKPVVLTLSGGRPFAIPEYYRQSSAVLATFYGGQSSGQAVADVLFGKFNPGGRLPITVPRNVGQLPAYYNFKPSSRLAKFVDISSEPMYPFGHGLSYTKFSILSFSGSTGSNQAIPAAKETFTNGDWIYFSTSIQNVGSVQGSYVVQVYLLGRVSQVTQPLKQLVAFKRVYLLGGETRTISLMVDVDRYLKILNRDEEWELEKGNYTFAILENGGNSPPHGRNVTLRCV
jgi:hypothetical protein